MKPRLFNVNLRFNYLDEDRGWTSNLVGCIRVAAENGTEAEGIAVEKAQRLLRDDPDRRYWTARSAGLAKGAKWDLPEETKP
jgi:hypothetical protein